MKSQTIQKAIFFAIAGSSKLWAQDVAYRCRSAFGHKNIEFEHRVADKAAKFEVRSVTGERISFASGTVERFRESEDAQFFELKDMTFNGAPLEFNQSIPFLYPGGIGRMVEGALITQYHFSTESGAWIAFQNNPEVDSLGRTRGYINFYWCNRTIR